MKKLTLTVSPHIHSPMDTRSMMKAVIVSLIPAVAASLFFYRWNALFVTLSCIAGCVSTEYALQKLRRKKVAIRDLSAILTGVLLAMVLPPATPLWMSFLGGVFAIALGKEVFGGLGHNIFNPALLARAFLMAAFPVTLTTWSNPFSVDAMTTATPLGIAKFEHVATSWVPLMLGNIGGCIGETSAIALVAGGLYLLYIKVVDYRIPVAYIGTVGLFSTVTHLVAPGSYVGPVFHLLAGGLLLGAFFMATDPVTSPVTAKGRWIFGIGCGLITMIIRLWGGLPEGVMYSILLMNAVTPLIDRFARPRRFGVTHGK
ncbi:MAG: RnfABCDGE type electron transport complex subunit D [Candidatus Omnitrophica bacterium]|nr:RnfABCDGE type electron transport complex subunit D [Candidatus Omnitrophota bacterium]MDD5488164.1 RnfABCDGE type electron transport complex subunit D [Candidatus Omnitrophota bacterium]